MVLGDPGLILQTYARERDAKNIAMTQVIDAILKSYALPSDSAFGSLRSLAITGINALSPLRQMIVSTAIN
ncbi:hypothetical protein DI09_177p30 [Mitosporidium daphniae]|uniref:Uncharacterized protein n=1 Tax=Mitosporidium daphniae TaxID=1485682 RepID=A0A098VTY4_9MICR|nr:hypothetical protein DI09_177p30 [Mitosporidium daphniae]|eukprot:XP_013238848.1 uncharacterized protein DI09_177p30 [Mitosporidium daphniae]